MLTCHFWISQFSFGNSSHVECPHRTGEPISDPGWDPLPPLHPYPTGTKPDASPVLTSLATTAQLLSPPTNRMSPMMPFPTLAAPSWNVSVDTQARQLVLHFSSTMQATFSAAWSPPSLGQDSLVPPVYSISQVWPSQGSPPPPYPPHPGLVAQSTASGDTQISNLYHLVIYLLDQSLFSWFLCLSVGSSMEQFLILLVSELTGGKQKQETGHPTSGCPLTHTVCCHILYQCPLLNPAVLYPCVPVCLHEAPDRRSLPILGGRAPGS